MENRYVIDTTILVDFFRARKEAIDLVDRLVSRNIVYIPSVVQAELYYGCRDKAEETDLDRFFEEARIVKTVLDRGILKAMSHLVRRYRKSHNAGLVDMLIAATAVENDAAIITLNVKHFEKIEGLRVERPY
jgi:predicted nucleic acid-binding protein